MRLGLRLGSIGALCVLSVSASEVSGGFAALFRERATELGLEFEHVNGAAGRYHLPEIMGAGGALFDYDTDGDLDVLLIQGRPLEASATGAAPLLSSHLFRNDLIGSRGVASLRFTDVTARAGFAPGDYGMGVAAGDYDNDGLLDLFVANRNQRNSLYHNDGNGTFTAITNGSVVNDVGYSWSPAWIDYDNDGFLDLFVANGPVSGAGQNNFLYRNNGDGTFTRITTGSIVNDGASSDGCAWADYNYDGCVDLFVSNLNDQNNQL